MGFVHHKRSVSPPYLIFHMSIPPTCCSPLSFLESQHVSHVSGRWMFLPWQRQPSPARPCASSAAWTALVTSPLHELGCSSVSAVQHTRLWIWREEAAPCSKCMSSCSRRAWDEVRKMNFMFNMSDLADLVTGMCLGLLTCVHLSKLCIQKCYKNQTA